MAKEYWVLSQDNIPELTRITGKTEDELQEMYEEALLFGHVHVFWHVGIKWFGLKVSAEYVHYGLLERVVEKAIEETVNDPSYGDRRD